MGLVRLLLGFLPVWICNPLLLLWLLNVRRCSCPCVLLLLPHPCMQQLLLLFLHGQIQRLLLLLHRHLLPLLLLHLQGIPLLGGHMLPLGWRTHAGRD